MTTVNRGSMLTVDYFKAYLQLICDSRSLSVEDAAEFMKHHFFRGDLYRYGPQTFERFQEAITLLKKIG